MCTLTIFTHCGNRIITMNRDEYRSRHESNQVQHSTSAKTEYYHPVDQLSGGTWLGFNNYGYVMALLNRYEDSNNKAQKSRGLIIPHLLQFNSNPEIIGAINNFSLIEFQPFDLLVSNADSINQFSWNGKQLTHLEVAQNQPFFITSSSVEGENVRKHRHELFNLFNRKNPDKTAEKVFNNFHFNQNKNDTSSSVYMSRDKTHTKSISQIILNQKQLNYRYYNQQQLLNLTNESEQLSCQSIKLILNC